MVCVKDMAAQLREGGREIDIASTRIVDEYIYTAPARSPPPPRTKVEPCDQRKRRGGGRVENRVERHGQKCVRACVRANGGCDVRSGGG